jgi:hypothetical protein
MGIVLNAPSPASAYYNQRHAIAATSPRLKRLRDAIGDPVNLSPCQWAQWFAYAREYAPDLVIELGRGNGNSTVAVNEALHQLGHGRLVSFCFTPTWQEVTVPLLTPLVEPGWFDRVDARVGDILGADFSEVIGDARRVLLIWDAHGFEIASLVLGHILPLLADREHFVVMHDISDIRFRDPGETGYAGRELWQGMNWAHRNPGSARVCLGWISTIVDQPIAVVDFLTRNRGRLRSADECFHEEIGGAPQRLAEMKSVLPPEDWSMIADWAWFTLNEWPGPYTFPRFVRPSPAGPDGRTASETGEIQAASTANLARIVARRLWRRIRRR